MVPLKERTTPAVQREALAILLNPDERAALDALAKAWDRSRSDTVRQLVRRASRDLNAGRPIDPMPRHSDREAAAA
jgi:hypothetical protein